MTRYEEQMYNDIHRIANALANRKSEVNDELISRTRKTIDDKSRLTLSQDVIELFGHNVIVDVYDNKIIITKGGE